MGTPVSGSTAHCPSVPSHSATGCACAPTGADADPAEVRNSLLALSYPRAHSIPGVREGLSAVSLVAEYTFYHRGLELRVRRAPVRTALPHSPTAPELVCLSWKDAWHLLCTTCLHGHLRSAPHKHKHHHTEVSLPRVPPGCPGHWTAYTQQDTLGCCEISSHICTHIRMATGKPRGEFALE